MAKEREEELDVGENIIRDFTNIKEIVKEGYIAIKFEKEKKDKERDMTD